MLCARLQVGGGFYAYSLIYEMLHSGHRVGGAALCVGGGPAMASLWERI